MTIQDIYRQKASEPTPKQVMIADLMRATGKSYDTVLSWCLGRRNPSKGERCVIAKALGVESDELFPK